MTLSPSAKPPRFGWEHVVFALAIGMLCVSFGIGLVHSLRYEGGVPGLVGPEGFADRYEARGDYDKALQIYQFVARRAANDILIARRIARLAARSGNVRAELEALRHLAAIDGRNPQTHADLAAALMRLGQPLEAVLAYRKALALEPRSAGLHNGLGIALAMAGRPGEAAAAFEAAVAITPDPMMAANLARAREQAASGGRAVLAGAV